MVNSGEHCDETRIYTVYSFTGSLERNDVAVCCP